MKVEIVWEMTAYFTRTSILPCFSIHASTSALHCSLLVTSAVLMSISAPLSARILSCVCFAVSMFKSQPKTLEPCCVNTRAVAAPLPHMSGSPCWPTPVTEIVLVGGRCLLLTVEWLILRTTFPFRSG